MTMNFFSCWCSLFWPCLSRQLILLLNSCVVLNVHHRCYGMSIVRSSGILHEVTYSFSSDPLTVMTIDLSLILTCIHMFNPPTGGLPDVTTVIQTTNVMLDDKRRCNCYVHALRCICDTCLTRFQRCSTLNTFTVGRIIFIKNYDDIFTTKSTT